MTVCSTESEKQGGAAVKGGDDGDNGAVRMELEEGGECGGCGSRTSEIPT